MRSGLLLELRGIETHLRPRRGPVVRAVDGVTLGLDPGQVIGLVGESGSGKSTLARTALRLIEPTAGQILFDGIDISHLDRKALRPLRRRMQMIFQDPRSSLSPRMTVRRLLDEPAAIHGLESAERIDPAELLEMVELSPSRVMDRHPHELSGGQARRVGIARALSLRPDLLIADEPTSGLDVSAAASVLNLMRDLSEQLGLAYVLITHDLATVGYTADRIAVMYLGRIVEEGPTNDVLRRPAHPYTRALFAGRHAEAPALSGEVPSPTSPPPGCRFHPRCPMRRDRCARDDPPVTEVAPGHTSACWFREEVS
jgi:oligopeptide/dipeptide ABC transporter ATP-binding protein